MATRHKLTGGLEFYDDESVECDCGCTVEAGDSYTSYIFETLEDDGTSNKCTLNICWDSDCIQYNIREFLKGKKYVRLVNEEEHHLMTSYEEYEGYQDYLADHYDRYED